MRRARTGLAVLVIALVATLAVWRLNRLDEEALPEVSRPFVPTAEQRVRGAYLALAGNCAGCHTTPGGAAYSGGRAIATPFGTLYTSNLTPDANGLGGWSAAHFWRALHNGRSRDGRLLYPAFPYAHYTRITREDSDALFAFLQSLPPVAVATPAHQLRFPYDQPVALAVWRALFFRPGVHRADPAQPAEWNRGAYLASGLGHCGACHSPRNALGATASGDPLTGGAILSENWVAPSLRSSAEAGLRGWPQAAAVALLHTGIAPGATTYGPMGEVVFRSLQYLTDADVGALATYLRSLPPEPSTGWPSVAAPPAALLARGERIYGDRCVNCHGARGEGGSGFPPLAGNRAVTLPSPANVVQVILHGGFSPATAGNPRPHGMPPFLQTLDDGEVAAVASYVRNAWGNQAATVDAIEAWRLRGNAE